MPKPFLTEAIDNRQLRSIQTNVEQVTKQLREGPFGDGNLVSVTLVVGYNTVEHGLARPIQGFVVCDFSVDYATFNGGSDYPMIARITDPATGGYTIDENTQVLIGSWWAGDVQIWFW